jgi:sulfite exporter TauE/SafE
MDPSLALTALWMGLAGGPHCLAMCGPVCAALGAAPSASPDAVTGQTIAWHPTPSPVGLDRLKRPSVQGSSLVLFQLGRLLSYTVLGAVAAASMQAVGWLSVHSAALRPIWTFIHVAAAVVGAVLLWRARQPLWLDGGARWVWGHVRTLAGPRGGGLGRGGPLILGLGWSFLPCGLLYSALLVAALSPGWWQGAGVMALFALGSSVSLLAGPWLWLRWGQPSAKRWAMRVAGAVLLASSVWALWLALAHDTAPWCLTPASTSL